MAEAVATLAELVTINDRNLADLELPNFFGATPFMENNAATTASYDTKHRWLRYVLPSTGFRAINNGREVQKSVDSLLEIDLAHYDASFRVDRALVSEYHKGGTSGWLNRELARHLKSLMIGVEDQMFNGTDATNGFAGLSDHTLLANLGAWCVSAGGSTASSQTSAYLVHSGPEGVEIVTGYSGNIAVSEPTIQETAGATGTFPAIYVGVGAWYGLKVGTIDADTSGGVPPCAVRIANIETAFDDDDIYAAIEKFDTGLAPTDIYMNAKAAELLRKSRTATTTTGAPPPMPETVGNGIRVHVTNAIGNTEAVVT